MLEIYNEDVRDLLTSYDGSGSFASGNGSDAGGGDGGVKLEIRRGSEGMIQVRTYVNLWRFRFHVNRPKDRWAG